MRRTRSVVALLLGSLLLMASLGWRYFSGPNLAGWGLPLDLAGYDVAELTLPPATEHADWLREGVKVLDASHSALADLSRLPESLEDLNVSNTQIRQLPRLPPRLKRLDVTTTAIESLEQLPAGLLQLKVGSTQLRSLNNLPPRLEELYVNGAILADLRSLPAHLKVLRLEATGIESIEGIPRYLHSLALIGTRVKSLKGLPETLESLELSGNAQLELDFLPKYLNRLVIDQANIPDLSRLQYLTDLDAIHAIPKSGESLPDSLVTLRVRDLPAKASKLPRDLKTLGLLGAKPRSLSGLGLPQDLRSLALDSCLNSTLDGDLDHLPASLQQLGLRFSQVSQLSHLPAKLLELDLSGTPLQHLPALPDSLRVLRLPWTQVKELPARLPPGLRVLDLGHCRGITSLPPLPEALQELLIGDTGISRLPKLSPHLKVLDIRGTRLHGLKKLGDLRVIAAGLPPSLLEVQLAPHQVRALGASCPPLKILRFIPVDP